MRLEGLTNESALNALTLFTCVSFVAYIIHHDVWALSGHFEEMNYLSSLNMAIHQGIHLFCVCFVPRTHDHSANHYTVFAY